MRATDDKLRINRLGLSLVFCSVFWGQKLLEIPAAIDFLIEMAIVNQWAWSKVDQVYVECLDTEDWRLDMTYFYVTSVCMVCNYACT